MAGVLGGPYTIDPGSRFPTDVMLKGHRTVITTRVIKLVLHIVAGSILISVYRCPTPTNHMPYSVNITRLANLMPPMSYF